LWCSAAFGFVLFALVVLFRGVFCAVAFYIPLDILSVAGSECSFLGIEVDCCFLCFVFVVVVVGLLGEWR